MRLAAEIVDIFHGEEAAQLAAQHFRTVFQQRQLPPDMPRFEVTEPINIVDLAYLAELVKSKSEGRRMVQQGAVRLDGEKIDDIAYMVTVADGQSKVLQVGKRKFARLAPAS
jgi:tyrosyl-tRNA synthetase